MASINRLAVFNHQNQDLDPIVEYFVKDSKGSNTLRPNSLQASAQRFASPGISRNSLQASIDLLFQLRIQSVVCLCAVSVRTNSNTVTIIIVSKRAVNRGEDPCCRTDRSHKKADWA
jgi:hypothetical protein